MGLTHPAGNKGVKLPYQMQKKQAWSTDLQTLCLTQEEFPGSFICHQEYIPYLVVPSLYLVTYFLPVKQALSNHLLWKRKNSVVNYKESAWFTPAGRQNVTPSYCLQCKNEIIASMG